MRGRSPASRHDPGIPEGKPVLLQSSFDDVRSRDLRFVEEAAAAGPVHVLLPSDELVEATTGAPPRFPEAERRYLAEALRWVERVTTVRERAPSDALPSIGAEDGGTWIVPEAADNEAKRAFCAGHGLDYGVIEEALLTQIPEASDDDVAPDGPTVLVSGCYDWLHSGHVRFFEEASGFGALYVTVGNDASVEAFKGAGHPMFPSATRRYMVGSVRHVRRALVATGSGWMDAAPEIELIRPDVLVVNEDGERPEKRAYCAANGIEYRVLRRSPKEGLSARRSTDLRGY